MITDAGFGPDYKVPGLPHRTGHGIGLDGHEWTNFVRGNTTQLAPGMCFSDEPTIVIYGEFGIRLEDCLHITEAGRRSSPSRATPSTGRSPDRARDGALIGVLRGVERRGARAEAESLRVLPPNRSAAGGGGRRTAVAASGSMRQAPGASSTPGGSSDPSRTRPSPVSSPRAMR